jgi:hypothetical protein
MKDLMDNLAGLGFQVYGIDEKGAFEVTAKRKPKVPSLKTLERWESQGYSKTPCGCKVEPDGECQHGKKSWLIILGFI